MLPRGADKARQRQRRLALPQKGGQEMSDQHARVPRLLCIGAHPDDCELQTSGLTALWTGKGGAARFLSMTDGSAGHQEYAGAKLAGLRRSEARAGACAGGADSLM